MKTIGLYAGSFNPFTLGHLGITRQASELFDEVVILIAQNPQKPSPLDAETLQKLIEQTVRQAGLQGVTVAVHDGVAARFAQQIKATWLIRGLRNETDFQYEETIAKVNRQLTGLKTVYFRADDEVAYVSSSMAMDLFNHGEDVSRFLPKNIIEHLRKSS